MSDKLNELGKTLGRQKKDSEAALRRYNPILPKIERTRDIFDNIVPFEMFFNNDVDQEITLDLFFNKPPPMRNCRDGRFGMKCEQFVTGSGDQLLQLSVHPYLVGSTTIYRDGIPLTSGQFNERDFSNGWIFVQGTSNPTQYFTICYIIDNYIPCTSPVYTIDDLNFVIDYNYINGSAYPVNAFFYDNLSWFWEGTDPVVQGHATSTADLTAIDLSNCKISLDLFARTDIGVYSSGANNAISNLTINFNCTSGSITVFIMASVQNQFTPTPFTTDIRETTITALPGINVDWGQSNGFVGIASGYSAYDTVALDINSIRGTIIISSMLYGETISKPISLPSGSDLLSVTVSTEADGGQSGSNSGRGSAGVVGVSRIDITCSVQAGF